MKLKLLFLFSLCFSLSTFAQTPTVVTGTVKDVNGLAYSFAKVSAQLIPTTASPTVIVNGIPAAIGGQQNANADVNGTFSMNLFCNSAGGGCSVISPSGTQWQITVNANGLPAPIGTGPQACSATLTITGASQSVSASFSSCPALSNITSAASFATLTAGTSTTGPFVCGTGCSFTTTGTGSIAATPGGSTTQVQFNNAAGALGGSSRFVTSVDGTGNTATITNAAAGNGNALSIQGNAGAGTSNLLQLNQNGQAGRILDMAGNSFFGINGSYLFLGNGSGISNAGGVSLNSDATTNTLTFNANANGIMAFSGAWSCVNITPVTTAGGAVTTDQNMLACTIPAGTLNRVGRTLRIHTAGTYSTAAASSAAMTVEAKLCTVSGCGSGVVVDLCDITTSALGAITITNNTWTLDCLASTQTAGASSVYERSGNLTMDLLVANAAADSVFLDPNATAVTAPVIDDTGQLFLQISGAFSVANASNAFTGRQLIAETVN